MSNIQPAAAKLVIASLLLINIFAASATKTITVARTVEGENSHNAQNGSNITATVQNLAMLLRILSLFKTAITAPAIIPTCKPDTANTCAVPV